MSSYGYLRVGSLPVAHIRNRADDELLALFRDDMLEIEHSKASRYYIADNGYSDDDPEDDRLEDHGIDIVGYRAPASVIADRLDMLGASQDAALEFLDRQLAAKHDDMLSEIPSIESVIDPESMSEDLRERNKAARILRKSLNARSWIELLSRCPPGPFYDPFPEPGSAQWLLNELDYTDYLSERLVLRGVLLAMPDAQVKLDLTTLIDAGYMSYPSLPTMASTAAQRISDSAGVNAPVVVLTEGRTDAEFLSAALTILYPHLSDLIRFLDYDHRPEGGVAALVGLVRAFSAAGIVNRVVAIFDNDTAAADGLRRLDLRKLPSHIHVLCYPDSELARRYPTLGPPTTLAQNGEPPTTDVNGLAASIELYLGRDVLSREDGSFFPVQWKSFIAGMNRYQGEVISKDRIHTAFRDKYAQAINDRELVSQQDWDGLRAIIDSIRAIVSVG